jgi:predicted metal-dependent peptidase
VSSRLRPKISKATLDHEFVPVELKTRALASAIYECSKTHPFMGSVLQCLTIQYGHSIPTAGIMFNTDAKRWDMIINPYFFCKKLELLEQKAVLLHELSHITHKHPLRVPFMKLSARKRQLMNIAMDMAINQFIKHLPSGCPECRQWGQDVPAQVWAKHMEESMCPGKAILVEDYHDIDEKTGNKVPWPKNATAEAYYEKLLQRFTDPDKDKEQSSCEACEEQGKGEQQCPGGGDGKGKDGGKGQQHTCGNAGGGADTGDLPTTIDEHLWDGASEEKDMLDATEELVKRAMVKARLDYSVLPDSVKELLEDIKARRAELNYKALIMMAFKRHAAGHDRKSTWTRKSKRFGNLAPGTRVGDLPKLHVYIDTSGSISIEEANEFLDIVDQFLRVGARRCRLGFFHTALYKNDEYKLGTRVKREDIQSGGTDLTPAMADILKRKSDLSVILTDGCYGDVPVEEWMKPGEKWPMTLFIISKQGTEEHPLRRLGAQTVKIPDAATHKGKR